MAAMEATRFTNLGDLIPRDRDLGKVAIVDLGGEEAPRDFTYSDLDNTANAVARSLIARGFGQGERIAILSANRFENLAAYFGIMRAGLVAVPVNFKFPRRIIHDILQDCGAKLVFCDATRRPDCPTDIQSVDFSATGPESFENFLNPGAHQTVTPKPDDPAMFLYTSGSSGRPKGVILSHHSHIWVAETRLGKQDLSGHRYLIAAPLFHMNALALAKLAVMGHSTMVILPQFNAREYIDAIARYKATWLTAVPPMLAMMLREEDLLKETDLSSVKFVRMGSAPVSQSLMQNLKRLFPTAAITNAYGTTEAGPVVFGPHPDSTPTPETSLGCAHPLSSLRLADDENRDVGQGVLEMKCPALMNGYHNRPDLRPPFTEDGFYITGDVFRRDENGFYYFVGRADDMFVSGGENIYPSDVERMLERHHAVGQAAVVPVDDDIKGTKPVAFIILKSGAQASDEEIKNFALENAPAYQHPRAVWFVKNVPLASTNKIDRGALKAEAAQRMNASQA